MWIINVLIEGFGRLTIVDWLAIRATLVMLITLLTWGIDEIERRAVVRA